MNPDAFVLALLAIGDLSLIVHLRQRHARRVRQARMMASLRFAVERANGMEDSRTSEAPAEAGELQHA